MFREGVAEGKLYERHATPSTAPTLTGKFPHWANMHLPKLGDGSPDDEAMLLARQIRSSIERADSSYLGSVTSETLWFEHFCDVLRSNHVSEATIATIVDTLGLPVHDDRGDRDARH